MDLGRFRFIPLGSPSPAKAISCDGVVPGAALDLSHWADNRTPAELKADTSTEIAFRFVQSPLAAAHEQAPVVNNHFDTDGLLACFTVLRPEAARVRRALFIAAAEAGDFQEWPRLRQGLLVDAAIVRLGESLGDEARAYEELLPRVPELLDTIEDREDLWGPAWTAIEAGVGAVNRGEVETALAGRIGVVRHPEGQPELQGPVIARLLLPRAWRYLLVFAAPNARFTYRYERPRYAWAETVTRTRLDPPDATSLLAALGSDWRASPRVPGTTGIVETIEPVAATPDDVLRTLRRTDPVAGLG